MRIVDKVIDINAHIEDLKCEISTDNGSALAKISFTNLGYGDITAIKFNACGYNLFGDIVPVNGKDKFFLIIQDVVIAKNETVTELKAKLPNSDMKKLVLEECQICYSDGSVVSYDGNNSLSFELEEIDDKDQLSALHKLFSKYARFKPKDVEQGWVCSCGRFNRHEEGVCSLCCKSKSEIIKVCSEDSLKKLVEEYKITEEKDRAARETEQKKAERKKKKRNIIIGIAIVICIILAFPIGHAVQMSLRTTYDSESQMKVALQGTWTCYDGYKIHIIGNTLTRRWVHLGSDYDMEFTIEEWNPKEGTFSISIGTYTVLSNGNIKDKYGNVYVKGGGWSDSESGSLSTYSYETARTALKFSNIKVTSNSSYTVCTGTVTNYGEKTYEYVQVKGSFKDSSGTVLDTDWTYAVGSEGLAPEESTTFRLSVPKNNNIKDCSVSIMD